jgi:ribonuclease HII
MDELDKQYPEYGFAKHKGYGTKAHSDAIMKYGPIDHVHRKTFAPIKYLLDDSPKLC